MGLAVQFKRKCPMSVFTTRWGGTQTKMVFLWQSTWIGGVLDPKSLDAALKQRCVLTTVTFFQMRMEFTKKGPAVPLRFGAVPFLPHPLAWRSGRGRERRPLLATKDWGGSMFHPYLCFLCWGFWDDFAPKVIW